MAHVAVVANQPTPYREHLLRRLSRELDGVTLHSLFTGRRGDTTVPWETRLEDINPVFFDSAPPLNKFTLRPAMRLFHDIRTYFEQHGIGLVVLNGYADLTRQSLISWSAKAGVPLWVRGDFNVFDEADKSLWKQATKRRLLRSIAKRATGFMPMGTAGRAFLNLYAGGATPMLLCPYEPDYALWQPNDPGFDAEVCGRLGFDASRKRFLCSGRLVSVKRVDLALDAFVDVADAFPEWDLVLAGDGVLRESLQQSVPATLRDRVKWLGFLQAKELGAVYRSCHALVHPAAKEPWGLIMNEAVAAGLPVITSPGVGGAIELVRHRVNGWIVEEHTAPAFARAMRYVATDDHAAQLAAGCPGMLAQWRTVADPVEAVREALRRASLLSR